MGSLVASTHDLRREEWRPFPEAPEFYLVSTIGRVRSRPGIHWNQVDKRFTRRPLDVTPFFGDPRFSRNLLVRLYWNRGVMTRTLRWVVAKTWVTNPDPETLTVACGVKNPWDCRVANLFWEAPSSPHDARRAALIKRCAKLQSQLRVAKPIRASLTPVRPSFNNNCPACVHFELEPSLPQNSRCRLLSDQCENVQQVCKRWSLRSLVNRVELVPVLNKRDLEREIDEINQELDLLWISED